MKPVNEGRTRSNDEVVLAAWQTQLAKAQDKPWLASLLLQQGERILRRFVHFYEQLRALPRNTRRQVKKRLATTLAGAALLLALAGPAVPSAHAATITVDGITCTLANAIASANTDTAVGGCTTGAGADVIDLQGNATVAATLTISSDITLQGNTFTIQRTGGANFRVLEVTSGNFTLNNATISGGNVAGLGGVNGYGGGILNNGGTVIISNSTISDNYAQYGSGAFNATGTMTISNSTISGNYAIGNGGGLFNASTLTISDSTVTNNSANGNGGGIRFFGAGSTTTLNRTIVSGNTATAAPFEIGDLGGAGTFYAGNYNLFGHAGETNVQAFLNFAPSGNDINATSDGPGGGTALGSILYSTLQQNGVNPHTFTHRLVPSSPAIDVIPDDGVDCDGAANGGTSRDQRGGVRANNALGSGPYCDIGAFEYGATTPTAITIEGFAANGKNQLGLAASGAAGVLALLSGGLLTRRLRRESSSGD